jgi:hypothetical protein
MVRANRDHKPDDRRAIRKYVVMVLLPELGITLPGVEDPGRRVRERREQCGRKKTGEDKAAKKS